jgi:hypothetical protein
MIETFRDIRVWTHALTPACAEVRVRVAVEDGVVRGRITGPRCRFASTVEVAYSLLPIPGEEGTFRAIIPEPSLWEPECPFLYDVVIESWLDDLQDERPERRVLKYGLRSQARRGESVLVNGRPVAMRYALDPPQSEEDARALRSRGVNLLCAGLANEKAWDLSDAYGFFLLGRLCKADDEELVWAKRHRSHHACLLAWLVDSPEAALLLAGRTKPTWLALAAKQLPAGVRFEDLALLVDEGPEPKVVIVP